MTARPLERRSSRTSAPAGGSTPREFTKIKPGLVVFSANDGTSGVELWKTDGSAAGTVNVQEIAPGSKNASPFGFSVFGTKLIFSANDNTSGRQPWVMPIDNAAPVANNGQTVTVAPKSVQFAAAGSDADGDQIVFSIVSNPSNGIVQLNADGTITYTPQIQFLGTDSFARRVSDGIAQSNTATMMVLVDANRILIVPFVPVQADLKVL